MNRYFTFTLLAAALLIGSAANAQTRDDKKGWHKQSGSAQGIEKGREGKSEVTFKTDIQTRTHINRVTSEASKSCAGFALRSPAKAEYLDICDAALAEPQLSPQNRRASLFNKSLILNKLQRTEEAKSLLTAMTRDYPNFADADFELGRIAFSSAEYPKSIELATAALGKKLPREARAYNLIGMAHEKDFEYVEARAAYETALRRDPGAGSTRRKLERLNRLWPAN